MALDDMLERPQRGRGGGRGPIRRGAGRGASRGRASSPYVRTKGGNNERRVSNEEKPDSSVYVAGLSFKTSWQDLKDYMRGAGPVVRAEVYTSEENGVVRSVGCGTVEYETAEDARNAIETLHDTELDGRKITVREDRGRRDRKGGYAPAPATASASAPAIGSLALNTAGRSVFVNNLPYNTSWQDMKDIFRTVGNVIRADVLYHPDGTAKGSGTVVFESRADALRAIREIDGREFGGRTLFVQPDKFAV